MPSRERLEVPDFDITVSELNKSTATVKIGVEQGFSLRVGQKLKPYKRVPELFRPAIEKVGDYVRMEMIPRVFEEEGPGWAPLATRTVNERGFGGYGGQHPILRRSGDLLNSLTKKAHPSHIEIVRVGKMARIEIGSSSQKFIENQKGMQSKNLPSRPMIPGTGGTPLPARDRLAIKDIIRKAVIQRAAGK